MRDDLGLDLTYNAMSLEFFRSTGITTEEALARIEYLQQAFTDASLPRT